MHPLVTLVQFNRAHLDSFYSICNDLEWFKDDQIEFESFIEVVPGNIPLPRRWYC